MALDASERGGGAARPARPAPWNDPRVRAVVFQVAVIGAVVALGAYLVHNTLANMARQGIATGFGYLDREASFEIGDKLIE
jgi:general L-amino acid transport system permease protein